MIPITLTIAESDSGNNTGVQADLKTFSALSIYNTSIITTLTAQNTQTISMIEAASPAMITAQIAAMFDNLNINAVKLNMLKNTRTITTVTKKLVGRDLPIILNPVIVTKSGDRLLKPATLDTLRIHLLPLTTLLTPNLPKTTDLLSCPAAASESKMIHQARTLCTINPQTMMIKGNHNGNANCINLLITAQNITHLTTPHVATHNTHNTNCTLSTTITTELAQKLKLTNTITRAHRYLQGTITATNKLTIKSGHKPMHHFHKIWHIS